MKSLIADDMIRNLWAGFLLGAAAVLLLQTA